MKMSMRLFKRYKGGRFLSWYVEFDDGRRKSLKTRDKTLAQRSYRKLERSYFAHKIARMTGKCLTTLGKFQSEFTAWQDDAIESKGTRRANALALSKLVAVAGQSAKLDALSQKHVDLMIAGCRKAGNKTGSINNYIRHCKAVLNKAVDWEYVKRNPLEKVKQIPEEKKLPGFIRAEELGKVVNGIKDIDLRLYVMAYIATGRRRSELIGLRWKDVNLMAGKYTIRKSKSKYHRVYSINRQFRAVLETIGEKDEGPVFSRWKHPDTVSHRVKEALVSAGYGHLSLHSLRHTYASLMAAKGKSLLQIQKDLGHRDIKATMIYTHLVEDEDAFEVEIGPVDLVR